MTIAVIAEKPSVARDIAAVLGATTRREGCLTGKGYVVTWAIGHLAALAQPHEIDPAWKSWRRDLLPMLPRRWPAVVLEGTRAQFEIVERALNAPEVERIICATDAGREGELIFRLIYELAGCRKPFDRLWISSLTPDAIKAGFRNLRPGRDFDPLAAAARGRAQADWLVGMNLSRAYSIGRPEMMTVGRVQTPTLALLVAREKEIQSFVPEDYFEVIATFGPATYRGTYFSENRDQKRLPADGELAGKIVARARAAGRGVIESIEEETRRMGPPLLYDLSELQRHANRLFGFSAQRTLELAQTLYETRKLLSYPRTDSRHLSTDVAETLGEVVEAIGGRYPRLLADGTGTRPLGRKFVDDAKVGDHHAIIPTSTNPANVTLTSDEEKIYDLVCRRLLQAWHGDHVTGVTNIVTLVKSPEAEDRFHTTGTRVLEAGWKVLDVVTDRSRKKFEADEPSLPPGLERGAVQTVEDVTAEKKQTRPPKRLTEATLLTAMETAGETLDDKELSRAMKERGLGTPATRASIIETLLSREYIIRDQRSLKPTEKGIRLIDTVDPQVKTPALTGEWESKLRSIERGQGSLESFMEGIEKLVTEVVATALSQPKPQSQPPTTPNRTAPNATADDFPRKADGRERAASDSRLSSPAPGDFLPNAESRERHTSDARLSNATADDFPRKADARERLTSDARLSNATADDFPRKADGRERAASEASPPRATSNTAGRNPPNFESERSAGNYPRRARDTGAPSDLEIPPASVDELLARHTPPDELFDLLDRHHHRDEDPGFLDSLEALDLLRAETPPAPTHASPRPPTPTPPPASTSSARATPPPASHTKPPAHASPRTQTWPTAQRSLFDTPKRQSTPAHERPEPTRSRGATATRDLDEILRQIFHHETFRPHQKAVCESVRDGHDALLVMPTGAGKSLCYQLPGLARQGTTLVVSPLIALMEDQVTKLKSLGLRAERIHSGRARQDSRGVCADYLAGRLDFLFIAPERLAVRGFPEMLAKRIPSLIAVDEAHCISHWGHDFRPEYRMLGQRLPLLRPAPVIAMTATATPIVQKDIATQLGLDSPKKFIHGFRRTNIAIEVVEVAKPNRGEIITALLENPDRRPAILYAPARKEAESLAELLQFKKHRAAAYHAGMSNSARDRVQTDFLENKLDIIVATIAFGMGIDKPDIRTVAHLALPQTLEGYYQEIGRAGRDGQPSRAILLHSFLDRRTHDFFLQKNYPEVATLQKIQAAITTPGYPREKLKNRLRLDDEVFDAALEKLWIHGGAKVDLMTDTVDRGHDRWVSSYLAQREHRKAQNEEMAHFTEVHACRMLHLIRHFGDQEDHGAACGLCDVCDHETCVVQSFRVPTPQETRALRRLLRELKEKGPRASGALYRETATDTGGTLDRDTFESILSGLARAQLIKTKDETFEKEGKEITYQKIELTHKGRSLEEEALETLALPHTKIKTETPKKSKKSKKKTKTYTPDATTEPAPKEVVDALKSWRLAESKRRRVPAFRIMTDKVLHTIATTQPTTRDRLSTITGIGPAFMEKYATQILTLVQHTPNTRPR